MKLVAVCGSGLGSSFMLEMNINSILNELGVSGVEVSHTDVGSATPDLADVWICATDIAESIQSLGEVVVLDNIIDTDSMREKLKEVLSAKGLL